MKIYFAGAGGVKRNEMLIKFKANRLFSYFVLIDPHSGYGEIDRFKELLEYLKNEDLQYFYKH